MELSHFHTIRKGISSFPGSDEIRHRNTAHARTRGPASFTSRVLRLEIVASISWTSIMEKTQAPDLIRKNNL